MREWLRKVYNEWIPSLTQPGECLAFMWVMACIALGVMVLWCGLMVCTAVTRWALF